MTLAWDCVTETTRTTTRRRGDEQKCSQVYVVLRLFLTLSAKLNKQILKYITLQLGIIQEDYVNG